MKGVMVMGVLVLAAMSGLQAVAAAAMATIPGDWSGAVPKVDGATQYFVAPDGRPNAAGTKDAPWDIASTLESKHPVKPGDIIWVRGGTYKNPDRKHGTLGWVVTLSGAEKAPIIIRAYPGEHATIDSGIQMGFKSKAAYVWLWDLELIVSDITREAQIVGSHPTDLGGPQGGLHTAGINQCKFINLVIHNVYQGISFWEGSRDCEVHGCLIYDNGWKAADRCHGHCIYTQNKDGTKTISQCIMSTYFGNGQYLIQAYGSKAAVVNGFLIEDNISYAMKPQGDRLLIGGQANGNKDNAALRNYFYNAGLQMGYSGKQHTGGKVQGNVLFNGGVAVNNYLDAEVRDNLVVGGGIGKNNCGEKVVVENNMIFAKGKHPDAPKTYLVPNKYAPTRANLAIFNWANAPEVKVSVVAAAAATAAGEPAADDDKVPAPFLKPGDAYRLMDPHDFFGKPVFTGKCDGDAITVPMKGEFAAFVMLKGPVAGLGEAGGAR